MTTIYLVEMTGVQAGTTVFRYCTGTGYVSHANDSSPNVVYEPRVTQAGLFSKSCHGGAKTFGLTTIGYGTIELNNADGGLDGLVNYAFDGQSLVVRQGDDQAALNTFTTVFTGTMEQVTPALDTCTVRIRDVLQNLDVPLQATKFAGNNVLPDGLEGGDDLKGKSKPICLGWNFNISPPLVNSSRYIFQVHFQQLQSLSIGGATPWSLSVFDQRAPITAGSEKTLAQFGAGATLLTFSVDPATDIMTTTAPHGWASGDGISVLSTGGALPAPLADNAPYFVHVLSAATCTLHATKADALAGTSIINLTTAGSGALDASNNRTALGCYDWCNDANGCYFRLGSKPIGQVTCDVVNPSDSGGGAFRLGRPNDLLRYLIQIARPAQMVNVFLPSPKYDSSDAGIAYTTGGVWYDQEISLLQALAPVLDSGGYYIDGLSASVMPGAITMGRIGYEGADAFTLTEGDITTLERVASEDEDKGIPAYRVIIKYKRSRTVMTPEQIDGSVSAADFSLCTVEWRSAVAQDLMVQGLYPNAVEIVRETIINDPAEAAAEATRVLNERRFRRDIFKTVTPVSLVAGADLGNRGKVTHSRLGLAAGGTLWLLSITPNLKDQTAELLLWK